MAESTTAVIVRRDRAAWRSIDRFVSAGTRIVSMGIVTP